jgi:nicotinate-nucleotide pyrophosphorylase (carboxylating)
MTERPLGREVGAARGLDETIDRLVEAALLEDIGEGDRTTLWTVDPTDRAEALIIAKEPLVVAGIQVAQRVFQAVDPGLEVEALVADGAKVEPGAPILKVRGLARGILTAERTALNFLGRLSGIATLTRSFVQAVDTGGEAQITDTRKTTPGWRALEKWAVRIGGGENHRLGLDDMVLIKDNHIVAAGGVRNAVLRATERNDLGLSVEVEVSRVDELEALRGLPINRILLDNMDDDAMREAVARISDWPEPRPELEASGNMSLDRVKRVAGTGVSWITVGALTHSAPTADLSLGLTWLPAQASGA